MNLAASTPSTLRARARRFDKIKKGHDHFLLFTGSLLSAIVDFMRVRMTLFSKPGTNIVGAKNDRPQYSNQQRTRGHAQ